LDKIFIEEKLLPRLTFNPGLKLTGFRATRPWGVLLEKFGGGVRLASRDPYSIYDQNLWYFCTILFMTWLNIQLPIYNRCGWHNCPKRNFWRAFFADLVGNDENVASSKTHLTGPLHYPVTWHEINYTGSQIYYAVGLSKQRKVRLDWYEFLCFGSPTA